jgi:hypothetical protein
MTDTKSALGRRAWIEAQAKIYQKFRGMSPADALAKAIAEMRRWDKLDAKIKPMY